MILHFRCSDSLVAEFERSRESSPGFSRECNGGAEMICRDDGGGRDNIFLFSAILVSISANFC
jgi:hypothetical protein